MDLFSLGIDPQRNYLPKDGMVHYYGPILSQQEADGYLDILLKTIAWKPDELLLFGKHITTKREVAWYGDIPFEYTYSNRTKKALSWTPELLKLKRLVEEHSRETFNSCLLNLYHHGGEGMAWHSDGETDLKKNGAIASLSFGAERKFVFKHKESQEKVTCMLQHGSLLVMNGTTQSHWLHSLPLMKSALGPRVNLTFRTIEGHGS